MNQETFSQQMGRLEALFNEGKPLPADQKREYWTSVKDIADSMFVAMVDEIRQRHRPHYGERFPSVAAMFDVLDDVSRNPAVVERATRTDEPFCQLCENLGMFLDDDNRLRFCICAAGDRRRAVWRVKPGADAAEYRKAYNAVLSDARPVSGIKEYNPTIKAWELTLAEHERWMARARERLAAIRERKARRSAGLAEVVNRVTASVRQREPGEEG